VGKTTSMTQTQSKALTCECWTCTLRSNRRVYNNTMMTEASTRYGCMEIKTSAHGFSLYINS